LRSKSSTFLLLRFLVRNQWLAGGLYVLIFTATVALGSGSHVYALQVGVTMAVGAFVLTRYGLLTGVAMFFSFWVLRSFPLAVGLSAWYWGSSMFALVLVGTISPNWLTQRYLPDTASGA
jgi:hypothetical protein